MEDCHHGQNGVISTAFHEIAALSSAVRDDRLINHLFFDRKFQDGIQRIVVWLDGSREKFFFSAGTVKPYGGSVN